MSTEPEHSLAINGVNREPLIKPLNGYIQYKEQKPPKLLKHYLVAPPTIGEGTYAKVKEAYDTIRGQKVAIKIFNRKKLRKIPGGEESVKREVDILEILNAESGGGHPNVIRLVDHFSNDLTGKLYIVLEHIDGGSLNGLLRALPTGENLPLCQTRKFFRALVKGLDYIHAQGVLHRDIKPDNLLLTSNGDLKVSDFGVAEHCSQDDESSSMDAPDSVSEVKHSLGGKGGGAGALAFLPPESLVVEGDVKSTIKGDIWSCGVVLYMCVTNTFPFQKGSFAKLVDSISRAKITLPDDVDVNVKDLILKILNKDPEKRYSLNDIRDHSFMHAELPKQRFFDIPRRPSSFGHSKRSIEAKVKELLKIAKKTYFDEDELSVSESAEAPKQKRKRHCCTIL
mmetsp:Transcript_11819/g.13002  ORF Transcript_11819/g.13002 Transcript_11819/m.13002 type:complete len:396 (-) Transcript_11819:165-1352(-)